MSQKVSEALLAYSTNDYEKAFNIFKELRKVLSSEDFDKNYAFQYIKTIYQNKIKNLVSITEDDKEDIKYIMKHCKPKDIYFQLTVFKVCKILEEKEKPDYGKIITWLTKLDYTLLNDKPNTYIVDGKEKQSPSNREKYFASLSKSYEELGDLAKAAQICELGLNNLTSFTNNNDIWFLRRIAKYNISVGNFNDGIKKYKEIEKRKSDWFILAEIGEIYLKKNEVDTATKYFLDAIKKGNSSTFIINVLKNLIENHKKLELSQDFFLSTLKLYIKTRLENEWKLSKWDIEIMEKHSLDKDLSKYKDISYETYVKLCEKIRWEKEPTYTGSISSVKEKFFFVKCEKGQIYCNISEAPNRKIPQLHTKVSLQLLDAYDTKKNCNSYNGVNIRIVGDN